MPGVPSPLNPPTNRSPQVPSVPNPNTAATPANVGAEAVKGLTVTPQDIPLKDWQAALASYIALVWMAEVPTLAPFAVAIAWGTAVIYAITTNLPMELVNAMKQGPGTEAANSNQNLGGQTQTNNPNPSLGEIVGNPGFNPG